MNRPARLETAADVTAFFSHNNPAIETSLFTNMVMSVNGGYTQNHISSPLGSELDRQMLIEIRNTADVILVGAATARAEGYSVPRNKQGKTIPLAIVTSSGNLGNLSNQAANDLFVYTHDRYAEPTNPTKVQLELVIEDLRNKGLNKILCEGGPTLLEQLHRTELIDTNYRTYSSTLTSDRQHSFTNSANHANQILQYSTTGINGELFTKWNSAS